MTELIPSTFLFFLCESIPRYHIRDNFTSNTPSSVWSLQSLQHCPANMWRCKKIFFLKKKSGNSQSLLIARDQKQSNQSQISTSLKSLCSWTHVEEGPHCPCHGCQPSSLHVVEQRSHSLFVVDVLVKTPACVAMWGLDSTDKTK